MDKKQRLLIIGIGGLSLLLAASVSLTVAWYEGSSHLAVNDINISLKDKELMISTDNNNFKNYLAIDDLAKVAKFTAVSSAFSDKWIEEKKDKPVFKQGYSEPTKNILNEPDDVDTATAGYFSQEFYIKSNTSVYVTFDTEKTSILPDEVDNNRIVSRIRDKFPGLTDEEIVNNLNSVVKSMRFSLLVLNDEDDESGDLPDYNYYIIDPYKDKSTYYAGILDTDLSGYYDYSSENKEVLFGQCSTSNGKTVEEAIVYKDPQASDETVSESSLSCFNSGTKAGVQRIDFEASKQNGLVLKEEPSISLEDAEDEILIPLHAETSKRIVLSFYQEGWDLENTDFVMYSHFFVNVLFKIAKTRF